ncbi:TPA: TspO protein [Candidatus Collierbacteria bacterium]|uniref:Integral membrane protein n=1 Tax=Candidatus Collierbacteria bacterium GW2011_GWA2_42_17 TaxID=1618378 RepID=A0A0G0Z1U6_9BACT|nr:MAG: Integral membrane protein [Candidatus Collierbacteria bacterium GW2011_GWB2_42_12]KKS42750.1 MAG: Integral membrane protein [Candidatus Collierbacteria bacterium GW2011_GWA2_42_17]KKS63065.1 MAG: Integral membrane protein [Candidatus Collierbacteria bacterium GW2011_GWF1_42_50]KKS64498.1 MAG: Integral membrane protein [Candidatus Collierbacteria bacterium GW2011_GWF2_42_51]HAI22220.1 TspO protein [Candidatus Collierbacteria bacterium]
MKTNDLWRLLLSLVISLSAGFLGALFTTPAVQSWYLTINKPVWIPPSWLFGPVWTSLFIMMGVALYLVWSTKMSNKVRVSLKLFAAQLVLNVLWSVFFFGLGNFWLAFGEILVLWVFILVTIVSFGKVSKMASWLMVPYLLWVTFASYLNFTIASLN